MAEAGGRSGDGAWRVVVADSSATSREQIRVTLTAFDRRIQVAEAETGRGAMEAILSLKPDLAFVSLQLPEMSGAEAVALARLRGVRPVTVLMSNQVMPKWVELSTELGAYEFLKRPFDPEHVVLMLNALRRMRRPLRALLVDQAPTARALVRRMLGGSQFTLEVDETDDGRHALKLMQRVAYDVALIETNLSGLDGLETACQARDIAPDARLLLMASQENPALVQAARHFGISGVLRKPFYEVHVDHALHVAFGLRRPYLLNALVVAQTRKVRAAAR